MTNSKGKNATPSPFEASFIQMLATGDGGDPCTDRIAEKYLHDFLRGVVPGKGRALVGTNLVEGAATVAWLLRLLKEGGRAPMEISPDGLEKTKHQIVAVLVNGWAFAATRSQEEGLLKAITSLPEHMAETVTTAVRQTLETNCLEDGQKADRLAGLMEFCNRDEVAMWVKYDLGRAAAKGYLRYVDDDLVPSAVRALLDRPVFEKACRRGDATG